MALKPLNSVAGFSVGETPANIILANGDVTTTNITTTGVANLNAIGNVKISGGSNGQVIKTDGTGNLSFVTIDTWQIQNGNSNVQVLANGNVTVSVTGTANVATFTSTGMNVAGYISGSNITANGNVSVNNYIVTPSTVDLIVAPDTQITRFYSNVNPFSGGYSLGNSLARWDNVFSNTANVLGNVAAGGLLTDNLYYANGNPWDLQEAAGSNTEIQFNDGNDNFGASANFTFDYATNLLTVVGNSQFNNANLGNLAIANFVNVSSNINVTNTMQAGNVRTDNLLYANGNPWDLQEAAGANTQIQYNDGSNNFGASANFTFNDTTNVLTVNGNANVTNTLLTPNINSGTGNLTLTSNGFSTVYDNTGNVTFPAGGTVTAGTFVGNVQANITITAANTTVLFSNAGLVDGSTGFTFDNTSNAVTANGNLTVNNANLGNLATANYINVSSNVTASNLTVNLELAGNTANFTGNVNAGNLSTTGSGGNITMSGGNLTGANVVSANTFTSNAVTANFANISSNTITNNLTVNLELAGNTANFSGNITSLNANLGNIADANYLRTSEIYNGNSNVIITPNGNISLSATGAGNVVVVSNLGANIIGYVTANGDGTFGAVKSNSVTAQGGNLELYSFQSGNTYIQLRPFGDGTVDVGNTRITSLATPNAQSDAATKQYVDDVAQGLNIHDAALAATANTLANLTGGVITYNNGASGVGANLVLSGTPTLNYLSANVFDGNVTAVVGSRILVKQETNGAYNGVYVVDSSTVLTRASDYNTVPEVEAGDFIFVQDGTTYNDSGWVQTSVVTTIGTDPILFTQFSGAGTYQAGQGLTLTGTVFSVNVDNITTEISGGNVIVKANAQFTTPNIGAATGTSVDLTGNVLAGNVNSNAKVTAVDFEASGNIIAANISANANLVVNNATVNLELSGNTANFTGNVVLANLQVNTTLSGNVANFSGNLTAANANLGNLVIANFANIESNVITSNLTVNLELAGNTANFSGNINTLNANLGNLATANYVNVSSNTVTNNLTVNLAFNGNTANFSGNISSPTLTANNTVIIGESSITWGNVTTSAVTANQTISSYTLTGSGVTGIEWLVKGVDDNLVTPKYSVATIQAVTDGTSVDFTSYGTVQLGGSTGSLAVNIVGSTVRLQVTPSSSNTTTWVTQYRTI